MRACEFITDPLDEDINRRNLLRGALGGAALAATGASAMTSPATSPIAKPVVHNQAEQFLLGWARKYIQDPNELAAFMAQCAHESDNFNTLEEYGTPERFAKKYDIQHNPQKAKTLGNTLPGDGVKYHGRGYLQLTGKYNYQKAGEAISQMIGKPVDFVKFPEIVAQPTGAALTSIWYWKNRVANKVKDFTNTRQVTQKINTGLKGEKNREQQMVNWKNELKASS